MAYVWAYIYAQLLLIVICRRALSTFGEFEHRPQCDFSCTALAVKLRIVVLTPGLYPGPDVYAGPGVVGSDYRCAEFTTLGQIALYRYNSNPDTNPNPKPKPY